MEKQHRNRHSNWKRLTVVIGWGQAIAIFKFSREKKTIVIREFVIAKKGPNHSDSEAIVKSVCIVIFM